MNNKLIKPFDIMSIFSKCGIQIEQFGYNINKLSIYQTAFTHKSYVIGIIPEDDLEKIPIPSGCIELQINSNERLEFLGDSIIGAFVVSYLYHRYPTQNEAFLTRLKTKLVRTETLAKFSKYLQLQKFLLLSQYVDEMCDGRNTERLLEDLFESFIGAVYKDIVNFEMTGMLRKNTGIATDVCNSILKHVIEANIDFRELVCDNDNYKEVIQHYFQKHFAQYPKYDIISVEGVLKDKIHTVGVQNPNNSLIIGTGRANKKIDAEQLAAKDAIEWIRKNLEQN